MRYTGEELSLLWPIIEAKGLNWTTIEEDDGKFYLAYMDSSNESCGGGNAQISYMPYSEQYWGLNENYQDNDMNYALAELLFHGRLVRLIDLSLNDWLELKYGSPEFAPVNEVKQIMTSWLTRSFKKQFNEFMEIKRNTIGKTCFDTNHDPNDVDFIEWLASKFNNHKSMDRATKDALWVYWMRGEDEEVESDYGSSLHDSTINEGIEELFRIDIDVFDYETPLCKQFKEFNYLLRVDDDVLTGDLPGFKTYDDFKNTWYYEWNDQVPWVWDKPWEFAHINHTCTPFVFKDGSSVWPTCDYKSDGTCNGGSIIGMRRVGNDVTFEDYEWYDNVEDCPRKSEALQEKGRIERLKGLKGTSDTTFWEWVHKQFDDFTKLSRRLQYDLEREWEAIQDDNNNESLIEELDDYLIKDPYFKFVDKDEEEFTKRKCQLLGIPYNEPPVIISEKFTIIKYSMGPDEEYAATKTKSYIRLSRTEENVAMIYGNIFRMKEEGWTVTRTK